MLFAFAVFAFALFSAFLLAHYHDLLFGIIRICGANQNPCFLCICTLAYPLVIYSSKFVFKNPNIKDACGCGESFSIGS